MRLAMLVGMLVLGLALTPLAHGDEKDELKKLQGDWKVTSLSAGGKEAAAGKGPTKLTFKDNKLTGLGPVTFTVKITADKTPKWIDLEVEKDGKSLQIKGLYELKGGELKLCVPLLPMADRPEGFDAKVAVTVKAKKAGKE